MIDRLRGGGARARVALRRVLRVARWESSRAAGGVDRRTLAAAVALVAVAGGVVGVGVATGVAGFDVDRDVYRVGVDPASPYADAVAADPSLRAVPAREAALGETTDATVITVVAPSSDGPGDGPIAAARVDEVVVRATDTRKGAAAAASVREAIEAHNERLMRAEPNETAAFPLTVTLRYAERSGGPADGHGIDAEWFDRLRRRYYAARGWSDDGVPTRGLLDRLNLSDVVDDDTPVARESPAK